MAEKAAGGGSAPLRFCSLLAFLFLATPALLFWLVSH